MARPAPSDAVEELFRSLTQRDALVEIVVLAACVAAAGLLVWGLRRATKADTGSIWFGDRIVDGVLFPVLALAFAFGARLLLAATLKPAVFALAVPILLSLVVIRLVVRVLGASFPKSALARVTERSISWVAWLAVALWIAGVLPMLMEAMYGSRSKRGKAQVPLRHLVPGIDTAGDCRGDDH